MREKTCGQVPLLKSLWLLFCVLLQMVSLLGIPAGAALHQGALEQGSLQPSAEGLIGDVDVQGEHPASSTSPSILSSQKASGMRGSSDLYLVMLHVGGINCRCTPAGCLRLQGSLSPSGRDVLLQMTID